MEILSDTKMEKSQEQSKDQVDTLPATIPEENVFRGQDGERMANTQCNHDNSTTTSSGVTGNSRNCQMEDETSP